ncbi:hypothetical protein GCM10010326_50300 [Streptomyces xanthochromogenes]|uniref:Uncharacterized protein n=1 Tax=Streptomyces xanthochromogenes TaxID=67384 RepID=A0ABQ3AFU2_9ACTN|nr:hypothetical protein GCM10010326_50300 [Streptomyces xanthochromogenes]
MRRRMCDDGRVAPGRVAPGRVATAESPRPRGYDRRAVPPARNWESAGRLKAPNTQAL